MDDRRGHEPREEDAVFAPARVATRGRPLALVAGVMLAIGGLIAAGALGKDGPGVPGNAGVDSPGAAADDLGPVAQPALAMASRAPRRVPGLPRPGDDTALPALVRLDLNPNGSHLFVHADVFSLERITVVVSLEQLGRIGPTRTVRMPGGSSALLTSANPQFDVLFELSRNATADVWIHADAYAANGDRLGSLRQPVSAR